MVVISHVGAKMRTLTVLSFKLLFSVLPTVGIRQTPEITVENGSFLHCSFPVPLVKGFASMIPFLFSVFKMVTSTFFYFVLLHVAKHSKACEASVLITEVIFGRVIPNLEKNFPEKQTFFF